MVKARFFLRTAVAGVPAEAQPRTRERSAVAVLQVVVARLGPGEVLDDAGRGIDAADDVRPLAGKKDITVVVDGNARVIVDLALESGVRRFRPSRPCRSRRLA